MFNPGSNEHDEAYPGLDLCIKKAICQSLKKRALMNLRSHFNL